MVDGDETLGELTSVASRAPIDAPARWTGGPLIAGLPWQSWLLLAVAVLLGLGIELAYFRAHRKERKNRRAEPDQGEETAG